MIWIKAKYYGYCVECGDSFCDGDKVLFDTENRACYCEPCGQDILDKEEN